MTHLFGLGEQLHDLILADVHLTSIQKANMALALGQADRCLVDGADETLQLLNVLVSAV